MRTEEHILNEIRTWEGILSTVQMRIQKNPDKPQLLGLLKEHHDRIQNLQKELQSLRQSSEVQVTLPVQPAPVLPSPIQAQEPIPLPKAEPCPHHAHHHHAHQHPEFESGEGEVVESNPIRQEQLEILVTVLAGVYQSQTSILDLGIGSGLVQPLIFNRLPQTQIVGLDHSPDMLALARNRLSNYQCEFVQTDITKMKVFQIPPKEYSAVISVDTFHSLSHEAKRRLFSLIYQLLNAQGVFLLMDRVSIPNQSLYPYYQLLWQRQEQLFHTAIREGDSFQNHQQRLEAKGDYSLSLDQLLQELKDTGFEPTCLHLHANRVLIAAHRGND